MRHRYESYRRLLAGLQEQVPDHPSFEYEPALEALVNARYYEVDRHFGWLIKAGRQLRIAEQALAEVCGAGHVCRVQLRRRVAVRWLAFAGVLVAVVMSASLLFGQAPQTARPSRYTPHTASNNNASTGNVTVSNNSECGINVTCGDVTNNNP